MVFETSPRTNWSSVGRRFGILAALWFGLTGTEWGSWLLGLPVILASVWLSRGFGPVSYWKWSVRGVLPFAWYFTRQSIRGGWDVAWRALGPVCRLKPGVISYSLCLPAGPSQLFFCGIVSLLPGTLVISLIDSEASIHVLDISAGQETELRKLEERIADLFALPGLLSGEEKQE